MTRSDDLLRNLGALLGSRTVSYTNQSAANDVYEGFVFSHVVSTASAHGAVVHYEDVREHRVNDLVFRTSPGNIYSTARPYTHAVVSFDRTPALEVHIGVYVQGNSRVMHECDVLILQRDEAYGCRTRYLTPRAQKCLLAIECKYYVTSLPLGQARGFVGLSADLGNSANSLFVTNNSSDTVVRYLNHRRMGWEHRMLPGSSQESDLRSEIRKAFRRHTSPHNPALQI